MYFEDDDENDVLSQLADLFDDLDLDGPTPEQLYRLYGIFKNDFITKPIIIGTIPLGFEKRPSRHPLFKGKPEGFEHICTRESKQSGKRYFDPERSNKIHWIKPIIENQTTNTKVKYFERVHSNGQNQRYYWFDQKEYVVIVREITTSLKLVTAFKVDHVERARFRNWFNAYRNGRA